MNVLKRTILVVSAALFAASCAGSAISAEEYYTIGMAYFEMGKYDDAERWLNRALSKNNTMRASEYNLGRIAYETGRYTEASRLFQRILKKDPKNAMALKAEAYTQIKMGNLEKAKDVYQQVMEAEPESADSGYNYALILYAMDKPEDAEKVLLKYDFSIFDNKDTLLLLARLQKAQKKLDAIDTYDKWLEKYSDPQVLYEYASVLETGGFYAKALEVMQKSYDTLTNDTETLKRNAVRFGLARLMLIADPTNDEAIRTLTESINSGYNDMDAINDLIKDKRLPKSRQDEIQRLADTLIKTDNSGKKEDSGSGTDSTGDDSSGTGTETENKSE
ncbi:MAG: tetratricopeptide repeat protein [Spirochaetaceae bacterium]|jgi:tetratricopeptide (TPR) repeat protein|nr:tetratricopeptide repeat protein [Spirochaetaceae bacterium]